MGWKRGGGGVASPKDIKHARRTRHIFLLFHFVILQKLNIPGESPAGHPFGSVYVNIVSL